jgi:hypothetical protein
MMRDLNRSLAGARLIQCGTSACCSLAHYVTLRQDASPWVIIDLFRTFAVHGVVVMPLAHALPCNSSMFKAI